jgi:SecDF, P1 head subdomain
MGRDHRWVGWLPALVIAFACNSTEDMPSPSGSSASTGVLQLRPVIEIVPRSAADWDATQFTCPDHGESLRDCVSSALDAPRIVLPGPTEAGEDKYVLGPRIVDGSDVEGAIAQPDAQPGVGWMVYVDLTNEGTERFETATEAAAGSAIAIIIDGRIVSAPVVAVPISSGDVVIARGLTQRQAGSLASLIDPG